MNPTELTPAELRDELDRIDRMQGPLTAATMMRRNMVRQELERRPVVRTWTSNKSRPLIDPTKVAAARTQLAALRGVGQ